MNDEGASPGGEDAVDAAKVPKNLRRAKTGGRWLRDIGAVLAVGGGGVGIGLMLGNLPIQRGELIALFVIASLLFLSLGLFQDYVEMGSWWIFSAILLAIFLLILIFGLIGIVGATNIRWPIKAETRGWWITVGIALFFGLVGLAYRRLGDFALDQIEAIVDRTASRDRV